MDSNRKWISLNDAKALDLVDYLSSLGHQAKLQRHNDFWYLSPLREEKVPSFKVNRIINRWYDHGLGKGGNLVDFAVLYHQCKVSEFLKKLNAQHSPTLPRPHPLSGSQAREGSERTESTIIIEHDLPLRSTGLLAYLKERQIPLEIAQAYCREIHYRVNGKHYFGIGFKNDSNAWELRNPYFKAGSSPKDISTINVGAKEVIVFEGFMDFLSYKTILQLEPHKDVDVVVLNSVSLFDKARPFMEAHKKIRLYLDTDAIGRACTHRALAISNRYQDESNVYEGKKDLNEWLMNISRYQKKKRGLKIR